MTPFIFICSFPLEIILSCNWTSVHCCCAELTWAEPRTVRSSLQIAQWFLSRDLSQETTTLPDAPVGEFWVFPPVSCLQWRHDTMFTVVPRLVLHSYPAVNQRDQLSDLSVATKHGITVPWASCHPNSPGMRATGTTALLPTQNNVVLNTPGKWDGLSHRRSRGHPNHGQSYTTHRWTEPLTLHSRVTALARETLWFGYQTLWMRTDLQHCGQNSPSPRCTVAWAPTSWIPLEQTQVKVRLQFLIHLLGVLTPVAELLEHESLKSCFCTWENWITGVICMGGWATSHSTFHHSPVCLPVGVHPAASLHPPPHLCPELFWPPRQWVPGKHPMQQFRPCCKQVFFIIVGV